MKLSIGSFKEYGARSGVNGVTFTFEVAPAVNEVALVLFKKEDFKLIEKIVLSKEFSCGRVYSVFIEDILAKDICYLISQDGELSLDPYCTSVVGRDTWADANRKANEYRVYSSIEDIDKSWDDNPVYINPQDMVMYKLHMRGFTAGQNMSSSKLGNYKGVLSKLSYLKELGVTSIEFMPLYDFEELMLENKQVISPKGDRTVEIEHTGKINYWGYGEASYFSPKKSYFSSKKTVSESLREMVSTIHNAEMEVIMEMSFDNKMSEDLIIDCLKYYVQYYHIDGFHLLGCSAPISRIAGCPYLQDTKIFYEFIPEEILSCETNKHLFLYNDSFMHVTRQIQNHMNGSMVQFANHMRRQNAVYGFVNYMSNVCGFSLWDSYSYGEKHNLENGEDNKDGTNNNFSFNYGAEGKTNNKAINANRFKEMRNGFTALFLSQSVPLIVAGDEVAATHDGNNNPYCQDNKVGYTVFSKTKNKLLLQKFVKELILFRKQHQCVRPENAFSMNDYLHLGLPDMSFHGSEPWMMFIGEEQKALGVLYNGAYAMEDEEVYVCYNYHYDEVEMALPLLAPGKRWRKIVNTSEYNEESDFSPKVINNQQSIKVPGCSITILVGLKP